MAISRVTFADADFVDNAGQTASGAQVQNKLNALRDAWNGLVSSGLAADDLSSALADTLGVSADGVVRCGKSIIATSQPRTNTSYGLLATPDRVSNVVLPTDGLIAVAYQATWQESVLAAAKAAIFIGANQLKRTVAGGGPVVQETVTNSGGGTALDFALVSAAGGLISTGGGGAYTGDVTTGQIVGGYTSPMANSLGALVNDLAPGGPCLVFAAAGTYDVSVQFKASSGSVTAKNRKLWVWTLGF